MEFSKETVERIEQLLRNYDEKLRDKAEHCADMMADWADTSQSETIKYAERYAVIRTERQRVRDCLLEIRIAKADELN